MLYGKLPTGTYAESIKCFNKALAINPNRLRHYVELGHTYALMNESKTARRFLEKGLAMPALEKDDPEIKALGGTILATLP
jgi:tetratricopeptide (TPR) repeat protein